MDRRQSLPPLSIITAKWNATSKGLVEIDYVGHKLYYRVNAPAVHRVFSTSNRCNN